jgi:hypothetical protein
MDERERGDDVGVGARDVRYQRRGDLSCESPVGYAVVVGEEREDAAADECGDEAKVDGRTEGDLCRL